jgi:hypothetical protein
VLADHTVVGDGIPWLSDADRASYEHIEEEFAALARTVNPDDPWSHPDADELDRLSVGAWLLQLRRLGVPTGRRGLGHGGAAHGRGARPPHPLRRSGEPGTGRLWAGRLPGHHRWGRVVRRVRGGLRTAGGPAARHPGRGRVGGAAGLARPAAPRPGRQGVLRLRPILLGGAGPGRRGVLRDGGARRDMGAARGGHWAISPLGGRATPCRSAPCTAPTSRRSTSAAPTSGSPGTWRAPSAAAGGRPKPRLPTAEPPQVQAGGGPLRPPPAPGATAGPPSQRSAAGRSSGSGRSRRLRPRSCRRSRRRNRARGSRR